MSGRDKDETAYQRAAGLDRGAGRGCRPCQAAPVVLLGGSLVVALLLGGGTYYWLTTATSNQRHAYTDGRAVSIAPQVSGQVVSLDVTTINSSAKDSR